MIYEKEVWSQPEDAQGNLRRRFLCDVFFGKVKCPCSENVKKGVDNFNFMVLNYVYYEYRRKIFQKPI
jgi:hypothetical protein